MCATLPELKRHLHTSIRPQVGKWVGFFEPGVPHSVDL